MPDVDDRLKHFAQLVASSPHNLVSRRDRSLLLTRHLPESATVAARLPGPAHVLDVGSGGGFPGLVIALIRPDLEVHLLDSVRKKTQFLERAAEQLGVRVQVHTGRAEELARGTLAGRFDLVTARAVAPLPRLLELTVPFLRPGGVLYAVKGARWAAELEAARQQLQRLRARVEGVPDESGDANGPDDGAPRGAATDPGPRIVIIRRIS